MDYFISMPFPPEFAPKSAQRQQVYTCEPLIPCEVVVFCKEGPPRLPSTDLEILLKIMLAWKYKQRDGLYLGEIRGDDSTISKLPTSQSTECFACGLSVVKFDKDLANAC